MNITIVTGEKASGKSKYLTKLITSDFDGVITNCTDRKLKKYEFNLIAKELKLICCYYEVNKGMNFNKGNFILVNDYLMNMLKSNKLNNIIIDELGWLELKEKGFYTSVVKILKNTNIQNLYLSLRYDIYKELINKFDIIDYKLINLS